MRITCAGSSPGPLAMRAPFTYIFIVALSMVETTCVQSSEGLNTRSSGDARVTLPSWHSSAVSCESSPQPPELGRVVGRGVGWFVLESHLHPPQSQLYLSSSSEQLYPLVVQLSQVW